MHIVVCIKQVPDHEGPRESYEINHDLKKVEPRGIPPVLSLFDENALEAGLRIKDQFKDAKITLASIGKKISTAVMLRALAAGADELIKIEDDRFDPDKLDSQTTAHVMTEVMNRIGSYDLILAGRQASDWNSGYMGVALAGLLKIPCITFAQKVEIKSQELIVHRVIENGYEVVKSRLPAVVIVTNELGELRYPAMKERREAKNKPIQTWSGNDMQYTASGKLTLKRLYYPELKTTDCTFIDAESPAQTGINLAKRLLEDHILPVH